MFVGPKSGVVQRARFSGVLIKPRRLLMGLAILKLGVGAVIRLVARHGIARRLVGGEQAAVSRRLVAWSLGEPVVAVIQSKSRFVK